MWLARAAVRRPVLTVVSVIVVLVLGVVSLTNLQLDLIPELNPPVGAVVASYPNAGTEEVLEKVTKPLEQTLGTLSGLKTMQSQTQEGIALVLLEFSWTEDINDKQHDILSRINRTRLPDDVDTPTFLKFDPSAFPIMQLSVANGGDDDALRENVDEIVQSLTQLSGVASVEQSGLLDKQVHVTLDADAMKKFGLSQTDVRDILAAHHATQPGGIVRDDDNDLTVRVLGELSSVKQLSELTITIDPTTGEEVTLADIADVKEATAERSVITRTNEEPSINLNLYKQASANTAAVSTAVQQEVERLNRDLDVEIVTIFDQGKYVKRAVGNVGNALIGGGILAMLVLFFFLRSIKSPFMIGIVIPFSVIVTFVLMYFADFGLNMMTLGGLALGVGMLVDNAIVVIENTYRHLNMGKSPKEAAVQGAGEVAGAITASTLTTLAVFLPIVFTSGIIGTLFREFSFTIAFSLLASLVVALTLVPVMAAAWLKKPRKNLEKTRQTGDFYTSYRAFVKWALYHRKTVIAIALILFLAGGAGLWAVGTEFLPATDEGIFIVSVELPLGTGLEKTDEVTKQVENILADEPDVKNFQTIIGTSPDTSFYGGGGRNSAQIFVNTVEFENRTRSTHQIVNDLRPEIEKVDKTADITIETLSSFDAGGAPNTLTFLVAGEQAEVDEHLTDITDALTDLDVVAEVTNTKVETQPELHVTVDRDEAASYGLAPVQIVAAVADATRGVIATQLTTEDDRKRDVVLKFDSSFTASPDALRDLPLTSGDRTFVLSDVADVVIAEGPVTINRHNQQYAVSYTVQYKDATFSEVEQLVKAELDELKLPNEIEVIFTGASELLGDAVDDLILAAVLSVLLVFLVLAGQFESFKYPFVILFTLPLMIIGVAFGLFVTQIPLGVTAMIGLIILAGIVVNNAIVLVDYINRLKRDGMMTFDAIVEASTIRFRPIVMTALTTILGLAPLALGIGEGTEIQQPMAITLMGGLISSTFLTLIVIPVVYSLFDRQTRFAYSYHPARPPRGVAGGWDDEQLAITTIADGEETTNEERLLPESSSSDIDSTERERNVREHDTTLSEPNVDEHAIDRTTGADERIGLDEGKSHGDARPIDRDRRSGQQFQDKDTETIHRRAVTSDNASYSDQLSQEDVLDLMVRLLETAKKLPRRDEQSPADENDDR